MRYWFCFFLLVCLLVDAQASSLVDALRYKRTFTPADGLVQATVYDIEQDLNGNIWLGTQSGLDRFDGYSFVNFGQESDQEVGLTSTRVLDLELNPATGDLWVGTASGLNRFNAQSGLIEDVEVVSASGGKQKRFNALHIDRHGDFWFESSGKLFVKRQARGPAIEISMPIAEAQLNIFEIESDPQSIIYLATSAGVLRFDSKSNQWLPNLIPDIVVFAVFIDSDDALWAGTNGSGLYHFTFDDAENPMSQTRLSTEQGLTNSIINDIEQDASGTIWVATNSGLSIFPDHTEFTPLAIAENFSDRKSMVHSLFISDTDDVLYGTLTNGFSIVAPNALLFEKIAIPDNEVAYSSTLDKDETLWVATPEGVWSVNSQLQALQLITFEEGDSSRGMENAIMSVHYAVDNDAAGNGQIWVGTRVGLARVNDSKDGIVTVGFNGIPIYTINDDKQGNLFLGTITNGLYHYDPSTNSVLSHYKTERVVGIEVVSESVIWLATLGGLVKINPLEKTQKTYAHDPNDPSSLAHNVVTWVSQKSENEYFVATQAKGLYLMTEDLAGQTASFKALFPETQLSRISIGAVVQDQFDDYWVTTITGIAKIDAALSSITFFDETDGTSSSGYFIGANSMNAAGRLFFAGSDGVTHFLPSEVIRPTTSPQLHITTIDILNNANGVRVIDAKSNALYPLKLSSLNLDQRDIVLSIEVAAAELVSPDKIQYAYRLKGFNDQWQALDSRKRSMTYTSLDAGDYILEVKATNRYGEWMEEHISMNIAVAPPWYPSRVAIFSWVVLFVFAIYSYVRWRSRWHYLRSQQLAAEVASKTRDLEIANEQLRKLSNLDPLTKIYNRRGFTGAANQRFQNFQGHLKPFCIVLFDIDFFKQINDEFGHDAGDEVLIDVTKKIRDLLGKEDLIGRWGGEEFIALLSDTDIESAFNAADTIRRAISNKPSIVMNNKIPVTLSGGVAIIEASGTIDSCIKKADVLLYQAKQNGRNQICFKLN